MQPIAYLEQMPVTALDGEGAFILIRSGDLTYRFRMPRSLWRKILETEMRRLNEFELAERADRGRVIPLPSCV